MSSRRGKQPPPPSSPPVVEHHHHHFHHDAPRREPPVTHDPFATYDALHRKVPKRFGASMTVRRLPWIAANFKVEVPGSHVRQPTPDEVKIDGDHVIVACRCGTAVKCYEDQLAECAGEGCHRTFWLLSGRVRVARVIPEPT